MTAHTPRVVATDEARQLIDTLRAKHGPLMFHQSCLLYTSDAADE